MILMLLGFIVLAVLGATGVGAIWLMSRRYVLGRVLTAVTITTFLSLIIAIFAFRYLEKEAQKPAGAWHPFTLSEPIIAIRFRPAGVYAETENHEEIQLVAGDLPRCFAANLLLDHPQARALPPTDTPVIELPPTPDTFSQQMFIPIAYPVATDAIGIVSFGVDRQGQVWCTERLSQGGPSGFAQTAASGFASLVMAVIVFIVGFFIVLLLAVAILELQYRRHDAQDKDFV